MLKRILIVLGIAAALTAVFANQLGFDNDAGWGGGRILLFKAGIVLFALGALLHVFETPLRNFRGKIAALIQPVGRERWIRIAFFGIATLTAFAYNWFLRDRADAGHIYNYYSELAKGFRRGNLYLPDQPSAEILALENPYDTALRKQSGIEDYPWDITLYEGRYYVYWGPSPALFLLPFDDRILSALEDYHLSLFFAFGMFVYSALILASFWRRLKTAPVWALAVSLLAMGFSVPVTTMLERGEVYETAIFACQFFFIGGCYWAQRDETPGAWKFALAGIHWAFAVGARVTILPVAAAAMLIMLFPAPVNLRSENWKRRLGLSLAAGIPLLAGVAALAWYNYARFGSVFEFGTSYQLGNTDYTKFTGMFGLQYIVGNLQVYFMRPVNFEPRFPFITLVENTASNDRMSGLLYVAPFIALILLPLFRLFARNKTAAVTDSFHNRRLVLFAAAAAVSAFITFIFFFNTLRYTLDFLPSALILIALSLGLEFESLKEKRFATAALSLVFTVFALANVTAGILLAIPASGTAFMLNLLNSAGKLLGLR